MSTPLHELFAGTGLETYVSTFESLKINAENFLQLENQNEFNVFIRPVEKGLGKPTDIATRKEALWKNIQAERTKRKLAPRVPAAAPKDIADFFAKYNVFGSESERKMYADLITRNLHLTLLELINPGESTQKALNAAFTPKVLMQLSLASFLENDRIRRTHSSPPEELKTKKEGPPGGPAIEEVKVKRETEGPPGGAAIDTAAKTPLTLAEILTRAGLEQHIGALSAPSYNMTSEFLLQIENRRQYNATIGESFRGSFSSGQIDRLFEVIQAERTRLEMPARTLSPTEAPKDLREFLTRYGVSSNMIPALTNPSLNLTLEKILKPDAKVKSMFLGLGPMDRMKIDLGRTIEEERVAALTRGASSSTNSPRV